MKVPYRVILFLAFFSYGISSCSEKTDKAEEKTTYVLPDSLLKTIEIDTNEKIFIGGACFACGARCVFADVGFDEPGDE